MNFLNPPVLFGLLAVSIPILIHLLNLSKVRKVEFSTLKFLKELQKSKMKRIKLRQLLLLALRILAIVFLVLAFADPVVKSSPGSGTGSSSAIVILDNSFSMEAENGKAMKNAKEAAAEIISFLSSGQEIYYVPSSSIGNLSVQIMALTQKDALAQIERTEISLKPFSLTEALNFSAFLSENSSAGNPDIFIISDFQRRNFSGSENGRLPGKIAEANFYMVGAGQNGLNNIALDSSGLSLGFAEAGMEISSEVVVHNYSQFSQSNLGIRSYAAGNQSGEAFISLNSNESIQAGISMAGIKKGSTGYSVQLEERSKTDDQLDSDNSDFFVSYVPEKLKVFLLSGDVKETAFVELALKAAGNPESESGNIEVLTSQTVSNALTESDVMIIAGRNSISEAEASAIREFAESGGGVLYFPAVSTDVNEINERLFALSGDYRYSDKVSLQSSAPEKFGKTDFDHPLLKGIFRNRNLSLTSGGTIDSPEITEYFKSVASDRALPVISLSNGYPFLTELSLGKGKMLVSSVSLSPSSGNFATKGIFVPLLMRSVNLLSSNLIVEERYTVGRENIVALTGIDNVHKIVNPENTTDTLNAGASAVQNRFFRLPYSDLTSESGIYRAIDSSGSEMLFAMNHDATESLLQMMPEEEVVSYIRSVGAKTVVFSEWDDIDSSYHSSKDGIQIWKYMLLLAIAALVAEKFLARKLEQGD